MNVSVLLPGALLLMAFVLKLAVDQQPALPDLVRAILGLPVDVVFLATSFVTGYTIATPPKAAEGTFLFACYIVLAVVVVLIWRRSEHMFIRDRFGWTLLLGFINYSICSLQLVYAVQLVSPVAS